MKSKKTKTLRGVDLPFYRYWQALYLSFFSARLYVDVGKRWKGLGVVYLLLLVSVIILPYAISMIIKFEAFFKQDIELSFKKLPPVYIQNGEVVFDKPMPYLVKNNLNEAMIIVDTTGQVNNIDKRYPKLFLLITKNEMFYRPPIIPFLSHPEGEEPVQSVAINKDMNQVFNGEQWVDFSGIKTIRLFFEALLYPVLVIMIFMLYLSLMLASALLAQLMAKVILKFKLTYLQAARLLIVSSTPQAFLLLFMIAFNLTFPGFGLVVIVLLALYFSFAVLALKRESNQLVVT